MKRPGAVHPDKRKISEYYSPPRVTTFVQEFNLVPGAARDYTLNENGNRWDSSLDNMRGRGAR